MQIKMLQTQKKWKGCGNAKTIKQKRFEISSNRETEEALKNVSFLSIPLPSSKFLEHPLDSPDPLDSSSSSTFVKIPLDSSRSFRFLYIRLAFASFV